MKQGSIILIVIALAAAAARAEPATQPSAPAKPETPVTVVDNRPYGFAMVIPRAWKVRQSSDQLKIYDVPGPGGLATGGVFIVMSAKSVHGKESLDKQVEAKKFALLEKNPKTKFVKDEAATLSQTPAWRLLYDVPHPAKETTTVNGKPGPSKDVVLIQRCTELLCIRDNTVVDLTYICVDSGFAAREKLANSVMGSFQWTAQPAAGESKDTK